MTTLEEIRALLPRPTSIAPEGKLGLTGQLVDSITGEPVAGANVSLLQAGARRARGTSEADGRFALDCSDGDAEEADSEMTEDPLELEIMVNGYVETTLPLGLPEMLLGRPYRLVLLDPCARVVGRVVDSNGSPVADAAVSTVDDKQEPTNLERSDDQGRFRLTGLVPGEHLLYASHSSATAFVYQRILLHTGQHAEAELVVREAQTYEVRAQVLDPMGAPLAGLSFAARVAGAPTDLDRVLSASASWERTDEEGRFALTVRSPGWQEIDLSEGVGDPAVLTTRLFASEEPREATLVVSSLRVLSCSLLDPVGQAVAYSGYAGTVCDLSGCSRGGGGTSRSEGFGKVLHYTVPRRATSIHIQMSSDRGGRRVTGALDLRSPDEPCVIRGHYDEGK